MEFPQIQKIILVIIVVTTFQKIFLYFAKFSSILVCVYPSIHYTNAQTICFWPTPETRKCQKILVTEPNVRVQINYLPLNDRILLTENHISFYPIMSSVQTLIGLSWGRKMNQRWWSGCSIKESELYSCFVTYGPFSL